MIEILKVFISIVKSILPRKTNVEIIVITVIIKQ